MLKQNSSLISVDLRENEGLTREYSRYIYKKLVLNMERYKQKKEEMEKNKESIHPSHDISPNRSVKLSKDSQVRENGDVLIKYKSHRGEDKFYSKHNSNYVSELAESQAERNNLTMGRNLKSKRVAKEGQNSGVDCPNCKARTVELLRMHKKNMDLELQLRKLKNTLLTHHEEISSIAPPPVQQELTDWLNNRSQHDNDDEMMQRIENIMLELTRVLETIEDQQNTKGHITNPLDNPNSFSNTVQLYQQSSNLQNLSQEIEEARLQEDRFQSDRLENVLAGAGMENKEAD